MNRVQIKETYLQCLDTNKQQAEKCTGVAKAYLECRMDKCAPPCSTLRLDSRSCMSYTSPWHPISA